MWNLAKDPVHYAAIEAVMMLREDLRNYVKEINNVSVHTGVPMMRPMVLEFPTDETIAKDPSVEKQFMLGPDWLVAPVTTLNATSWDVYVPELVGGTHEWIYWWNQSVVEVSEGGEWRSVDVAKISDFPLLFRRTKPRQSAGQDQDTDVHDEYSIQDLVVHELIPITRNS